MHIRRISVAKYRSNKEITIRILFVSVRIADIRKISICGYIYIRASLLKGYNFTLRPS